MKYILSSFMWCQPKNLLGLIFINHLFGVAGPAAAKVGTCWMSSLCTLQATVALALWGEHNG